MKNHHFIFNVYNKETNKRIDLKHILTILNLPHGFKWQIKNIEYNNVIDVNKNFDTTIDKIERGEFIRNDELVYIANNVNQVEDCELLSNNEIIQLKITCRDSSFWEIETNNINFNKPLKNLEIEMGRIRIQ